MGGAGHRPNRARDLDDTFVERGPLMRALVPDREHLVFALEEQNGCVVHGDAQLLSVYQLVE
jgi:hypothetical protein